MGRAAGLLVFGALFIVFLAIKFVFMSGKAAYQAVFNPASNDDSVRELIAACYYKTQEFMENNHTGKVKDLPQILMQCTASIQKFIEGNGYSIPRHIAEDLVANAIVAGEHATEKQMEKARAQ